MYLGEVPTEQRCEAFQDLIAEHLRSTWVAGQGSCLETYLAEFAPELGELATPAGVPATLVEDEFLARHLGPQGDAPPLEEYARRFAERPDVMRLLEARLLGAGRYVKLHRRGRGAMGEVWEAYDRHLRRPVAVKEPRAGAAGDSGFCRQFAAEAHLTAGLEHPAIVGVHEYHPGGGEEPPFCVLRLVDGEPLSTLIRDYHHAPGDRRSAEQRLLWHRLLQAFVTACDALAYAHRHGVLHRDLKPGNVVVGEVGETVVLDWGLGARGEGNGELVGTPEYMPPEQADGLADARSDVFGLGTVLYELLTGRAPHAWSDRTRPVDWPQCVRQAAFPRPRGLNPEAPRALEAICLKALARDPAERYQSAAVLAQDVRRYLAGEPVEAWSEPLRLRAGRWLRRVLER
jgi:serine/threonine protein kinase